jgi:hypothetical protein
MNAVTVSYISSGLEIGPDIPGGTETIVECHKFARFLLWIMASIHVLLFPGEASGRCAASETQLL